VARAVIGRWVSSTLVRSVARWSAAASLLAEDRRWLRACGDTRRGDGAEAHQSGRQSGKPPGELPVDVKEAVVDVLVQIMALVWESADAATAAAVAEARSIFNDIDTDSSGTLTGSDCTLEVALSRYLIY
jgi:hypothetical protein